MSFADTVTLQQSRRSLMAQQRQQRSLPILFYPLPSAAARSGAVAKLIARHKNKATDMDAQALMRINAQEENMFPVEIKVKMLMEQAGMRMRASRMVGERISQLDDVIRVRALLGIVGQNRRKAEKDNSGTERKQQTTDASKTRAAAACAPSPRARDRFAPCGEADLAVFSRMAVSSMKTVLFQLAEEGMVDGAKDLSVMYDGLVTTAALNADASEGFCALDVDSLLSAEHSTYRKLIVSRHRYLVRKLGVLLDMQEGVDKLLVLSVETEDEMMMEEMTDVSLQQQEEEDPSNKVKSQKSPQELARLLATGDGASTAKKSILTSLLNTSWDSGTKLGGPGSDVATEDETSDETDEETPQNARRKGTAESPQNGHSVEVSPAH